MKKTENRWINYVMLCVMFMTAPTVDAARSAFRLNSDMDLINYYINNPDDYPVCKSSLDYMHFDSPVNSTKRQLFDTDTAFVEIGAYGSNNGGFNTSKCNASISLLQGYENAGFTVYGVFLYREEWFAVAGGGGPFEVDRRILSQTDIDNFRNALAASSLNCKDTLKIFQLVGGRVQGELPEPTDNGDSWFNFDASMKTYLEQFDGIGTECHTVDINSAPGRSTLEAQAAMALWAKNLGKESLVFMGGGGASYIDFSTQEGTFNYLWGEMNNIGLDPRSPHLIYLRQGAHRNILVYDDHLPESDDTKLTHQVKWMIENVQSTELEGPTSGLVAHWALDEGSGTAATDASGYGFDGELLNGVIWGSDETRDSYVKFDGTDDRIETTFTYALADTNNFTWAWWAKKDPASHSGSIMVGNRYGNTGAQNYEFIKMTPTKAAFANTDSTGNIEDYEYTDIASGSWHHYAMVKSGTSYQWYVDGEAQGVASNFVYSETSPLPFLIGGDDDGSGTKVNEHFEGCIDDVVLYRSALTTAAINEVINGIYLPVITLTTLNTPVDQMTATVWSDGLAPHGGAGYVIPDTGNVKGESGTTTFPGNSLTVDAGGKLQIRSLDSAGEVTTVDHLILEGGTGANYALLAAGTGTDAINVLDGSITQSGNAQLLTYGAPYNRGLKVLSQINGDGLLQVVGRGATIDNAANTFAGTWQVTADATLTFNNGGAVGAANIDVLSGGTLTISDDWNSGGSLTVTDSATTQVDFGANIWLVSSLVFGGSAVAEGNYTASQLNTLGGNAVFSGSGTLVVNSGGTISNTLYSNASDAGVKENNTIESLTSNTAQVGTGGSNPWVDRAVVYVFQLPDLGMVDNPFLSSSFSFNFMLNESHKNTDLYGLGKRSAATVLGSDYYGRTATADPSDATLIQSSILTGSTDVGIITTENSTLTSYLNAQYAGGNGIGQYLFLRLNTATAKTGINRATITMSEGGVAGTPDTRPQLSYTAINVDNTEPPVLEHSINGGDIVFNWTEGGFKVQSRTNLIEGSWIDVPGGDTPPVTNAPTYPEAFFQLIEQ